MRPLLHRHRVLGILGVGIIVAGAVAGILRAGSASSPAPLVPSSHLTGELTGPAPWPANVGTLRARLAELGLPALAVEGTALHIHQHLDVYVDGRHVVVPAGIGIGPGNAFISPLHTHDATGVIHVESPARRVFSLGQFFGVWGVRFTPQCLGGYCNAGAKRLRVFVDGHLVRGDPRGIILTEHEEIVVAYGARAELPHPIPRSFAFPPGL